MYVCFIIYYLHLEKQLKRWLVCWYDDLYAGPRGRQGTSVCIISPTLISPWSPDSWSVTQLTQRIKMKNPDPGPGLAWARLIQGGGFIETWQHSETRIQNIMRPFYTLTSEPSLSPPSLWWQSLVAPRIIALNSLPSRDKAQNKKWKWTEHCQVNAKTHFLNYELLMWSPVLRRSMMALV